jgi:hypothetical protein
MNYSVGTDAVIENNRLYEDLTRRTTTIQPLLKKSGKPSEHIIVGELKTSLRQTTPRERHSIAAKNVERRRSN